MIKMVAALTPVLVLLAPPRCDDDCGPPWAYEARDIELELNATQYGSAKLGTSKQAIREIDARLIAFSTEWGYLCRDVDKGRITREDYASRTKEISDKKGRLDELVVVMREASSEAAFLEALRIAYGTVVDDSQQLDLQVNLAVMAKRPTDADYGVAAPNATLPTGTKIQFVVDTTAPAYLYIYQVDAKGAIVPLFPDMRIPVTNPVSAGASLRIPSGAASFTLNDQDIGTEHVHVVASVTPMTELESGIAQASSNPGSASAEQLDCASARGLEYDAGSCPTSRGLVYDDPGASSGYSVKAVNAAADDAVHLVYSFEHSAG